MLGIVLKRLDKRKHCEKRRKCWLPSFSPIDNVSKVLQIVKTGDYVEMG